MEEHGWRVQLGGVRFRRRSAGKPLFWQEAPILAAAGSTPTTPATLYTAGLSDCYGVWWMRDEGTSGCGLLAAGKVYSLAVDPLTPTNIYAATNLGVFRSVDAGANWTQANSGLTGLAEHVPEVLILAVDPVPQGTLYSGNEYRRIQNDGRWGHLESDRPDVAVPPGVGQPQSVERSRRQRVDRDRSPLDRSAREWNGRGSIQQPPCDCYGPTNRDRVNWNDDRNFHGSSPTRSPLTEIVTVSASLEGARRSVTLGSVHRRACRA